MSTTWTEKWSKYGVKGYFILIANQQNMAPSAADCKKYREDYGLDVTLLYDPTGATSAYGGMEMTYILDRDAKITYEQYGDWLVGLEKQLEKVLGVEIE